MEFFNLQKHIYIDLPPVIRDLDEEIFSRVFDKAKGKEVDGYFASSFDALELLKEKGISNDKVFLSPEIYAFSERSTMFFFENGYENLSVPFELNEKELSHRMLKSFMMTLYGKTPVMHLENCIYRNTLGCHKEKIGSVENAYYVDRLNKEFFDKENCTFCQNTLYNSISTSLFSELDKIRSFGIKRFRIDFTDEDDEKVRKITDFTFSIFMNKDYNNKDIFKDTTRGHFHRGVD